MTASRWAGTGDGRPEAATPRTLMSFLHRENVESVGPGAARAGVDGIEG